MSNKVLRETVHGNIIELEDDAGISDGQQVEIIVRRVTPQSSQHGEGLLRTEGALADDSEWDAIMEKIQQSRKQERRSQLDDA
jgi:hypothetical protein